MAVRRLKGVFSLDLPQHKRAQIDDNAKDVLKVIGAGLPRTGTTSLKAALEILGFDPCHHMAELIDHPEKSMKWTNFIDAPSHLSPEESELRMEQLRLAMRGYRATVDSPGCDVYRDLMVLYPEAKVVLSVRDSDDAWWKSFSSTLAVQLTEPYGWMVYFVPFLRANNLLIHAIERRWWRLVGTETSGPAVHSAHNQEVQANVPRERLLVFNVKMGWKPLCAFLDVDVPDQPFPNLNDAKAISKALFGAQVMGVSVWALYIGLFGLSIYLSTYARQFLKSR